MVWVHIIKPLGIANIKGIYSKILSSSKVRGISPIKKFDFSVIDKTTVASCLEVSNKAQGRMQGAATAANAAPQRGSH